MTSTGTATVQDDVAGDHVCWCYGPAPDVPAGVRRRLGPVLEAWRVEGETADDVLLVVTELVANVVDHAGTPFEIALYREPGTLHVTVRDGCPEPPEPRGMDPNSSRGRGLLVVQAVCRDWGYEVHGGSDADPPGKTIRAELAA
ncbi:ATP-binding protein [Pseudonocardia kujensis]|uniref:ATP-binding protein n=1 Tax=Pseudonocardia kujensis TaxID=1128675 RepID=UPI001E30F374|nr:ATP-binding protein [Pseudonocardia kujensis]MCE0766363.1 ATP-binding protein [Pseudonocardia kujensis]